MPELILPEVRVHASFLAAMDEFRAEGRAVPTDNSMVSRDLRRYGGTWRDPEVFARYVAEVRADALESTPRPDGYVPATTFWYVDGDEYIGRLAIRHRLTPTLLELGGHIGYDVKRSARRQGHATAMLFESLRYAYALGIDPVLLTCDTDNVASRKVIEACGGVFEDERNGKLRYWVPTKRL
jgi:predicted acetyltransferase